MTVDEVTIVPLLPPQTRRGGSRRTIVLTGVWRLFVLTSAWTTVGTNANDQPLLAAAKAVLQNNWRCEGSSKTKTCSTVPNPGLYPHQWSWDAAFHALGYSNYALDKSVSELRALFKGQWKNGMLPHIVFDRKYVNSYCPGPDLWRTNTTNSSSQHPLTSGIVDPPLHASAARWVWQRAVAAGSHEVVGFVLDELVEKLWAWHEWLRRERTVGNVEDRNYGGLLYIRHPWESGMDNSVAWDESFSEIKIHPGDVPPYNRTDLGNNSDHPEDRPTKFFYDRFIYLVALGAREGYDEARIREKSRFLAVDVLFNAAYARANADLAVLLEARARRGGSRRAGGAVDGAAAVSRSEHEEKDLVRARSLRARTRATLRSMLDLLYDEREEMFFPYDLANGRRIPRRVVSGVAGLWAPWEELLQKGEEDADADTVSVDGFPRFSVPRFVRALLRRADFWTPFGLPSTSVSDGAFSTHAYWRGPSWINTNFLVFRGVQLYLAATSSKRDGGNATVLSSSRSEEGEVDEVHLLTWFADTVRERSLALVRSGGFHEYFNPLNGSSHGAGNFSWSAALTIEALGLGIDPPTQSAVEGGEVGEEGTGTTTMVYV